MGVERPGPSAWYTGRRGPVETESLPRKLSSTVVLYLPTHKYGTGPIQGVVFGDREVHRERYPTVGRARVFDERRNWRSPEPRRLHGVTTIETP